MRFLFELVSDSCDSKHSPFYRYFDFESDTWQKARYRCRSVFSFFSGSREIRVLECTLFEFSPEFSKSSLLFSNGKVRFSHRVVLQSLPSSVVCVLRNRGFLNEN